MRCYSVAQHFAEYLILRACRHLRYDIRNERYREWTAELPAIFDDPAVRFPGARIARVLLYAADHHRGARNLLGTTGQNAILEAGDGLVFTALTGSSAVRALVADRARQAGVPPSRTADLVLAVNEIVGNSMRHTRSGGIVRIWQTEKELLCQVDDTGHIADPSVGRDGPTPTGGYGLWIVRHVCDQVDIDTGKAGTTVRMHMSLFIDGVVDGGTTPSRHALGGGSQ